MIRVGTLLLLLTIISGCKKADDLPYMKSVIPVKGVIHIDGAPAPEPIVITCTALSQVDTSHYSESTAISTDGGEFVLSTYNSGDGVPEGEYVLTFFWGKFNQMSSSYGGPDKLKKRYEKTGESKVKFTAAQGKPVDLGIIELTTK